MPPETGRKKDVAWEAGACAAASANFFVCYFPVLFYFYIGRLYRSLFLSYPVNKRARNYFFMMVK